MSTKAKNKMKLTKEEKSWIMYDWANSAYSLIIVTAILPIYFKYVAGNAGMEDATSTAFWGYASSFGTLLVSVLAPLLGTIADFRGYKKKFFACFAIFGIAMTFSLALVPSHSWIILLAVYVISHIGYQGANIFYDGFLVDVTTDERSDMVSSYGYGYGYIGSALLFVVVMILQVTNGFGVIDGDMIQKVCFVLTALWWLVFSIPFFKDVKQVHGMERTKNVISTSFKRLGSTIKDIKAYKSVAFFLIAYFFYIDGVDTIFTMATPFGTDMGIDQTTLIIILLMVNIVAFPFTVIYGRLAKKFGTKKMILTAIVVYIVICIFAIFMSTAIHFWILGFLVGTSQGGIQALSRSYFARIIPKDKANEFFGFYNIFGKFSAILGPLIFGLVTHITRRSQYGIMSLVVLFIIGGILFAKSKAEVVNE